MKSSMSGSLEAPCHTRRKPSAACEVGRVTPCAPPCDGKRRPARIISCMPRQGMRRARSDAPYLYCGISSLIVAILLLCSGGADGAAVQTIPEKLVVLTFDDAVKSHRTFVAPFLKELGLGATFFVTHKWMDDATNFMTWQDIAEINQMGFEIGNHSWTHDDFSTPRNAGRLAAELFLVNRALGEAKPKVPTPISFAFCGNSFGPEAVQRLVELGYKFARRGEQPEAHYGTLEVGATYDPKRNHPLLIPTTGDAYPNWSLEHLKLVLARATNGQAVVLQFHGSPDIAHPWVHTPPERLREYLTYLKENGFRCIPLRGLEPYIDRDNLPADPLLTYRQPPREPDRLTWPAEVVATRNDLGFWLQNMIVDHRYSWSEAARVCGLSTNEVRFGVGVRF